MRSVRATLAILLLVATGVATGHAPQEPAPDDFAWRPAQPPIVRLSGTSVTALRATPRALWIGTSGKGIAKLEDGTERRWNIGDAGLPAGRVLALETLGETCWALFDPDVLAVRSGDRWVRERGPGGFVHGLAVHRGRLWAASDRGLFRREGEGWTATPVAEPVFALASAGEGELFWALGSGRILRGEPAERASASRAGGPGSDNSGSPAALPRFMQDDSAGAAGAPGRAVMLEAVVPRGPRVRSMGVAGGRLAVGRFGLLEVVSLASGHLETLLAPQSAPPMVSSVAQAGGELIAGTWGHGVWRLDGDRWRRLGRDAGLPSDSVNAVAGTADYAAVGTETGLALVRLAVGVRLPTEAPDRPGSIEAAADGAIPPERLGLSIAKPDPHPRQLLRSEALGGEMGPLARLGDVLFEDPTVLGPRAQALGIGCGSCHPGGDTNSRFFIPGLSGRSGTVDLTHRYFSAAAENALTDPVDIPSLRGARLTGPYGKDGRTGSLREFIRNVIVIEFAGADPSARDLDALTAYVNEFEFLPNPLLRPDGRLVATAPLPALRGEAAFQKARDGFGGRSCASCHDPSAQFSDRRPHDVSSGGWFDTPSLLGALRTAPYFHDGGQATFADVVAHFDRVFTLGLSDGERRDLVAYLEAVGDVERPWAGAAVPAPAVAPSSESRARGGENR